MKQLHRKLGPPGSLSGMRRHDKKRNRVSRICQTDARNRKLCLLLFSFEKFKEWKTLLKKQFSGFVLTVCTPSLECFFSAGRSAGIPAAPSIPPFSPIVYKSIFQDSRWTYVTPVTHRNKSIGQIRFSFVCIQLCIYASKAEFQVADSFIWEESHSSFYQDGSLFNSLIGFCESLMAHDEHYDTIMHGSNRKGICIEHEFWSFYFAAWICRLFATADAGLQGAPHNA